MKQKIKGKIKEIVLENYGHAPIAVIIWFYYQRNEENVLIFYSKVYELDRICNNRGRSIPELSGTAGIMGKAGDFVFYSAENGGIKLTNRRMYNTSVST